MRGRVLWALALLALPALLLGQVRYGAPGQHKVGGTPGIEYKVSSGVAALAPNQVPNTAFWVRADTEVFANDNGTGAVADGGTVGFLGDSVGGFDLTQATSGKRPTLDTATEFNNQPALVFDGLTQWMSNAAFQLTSGATKATWFVVISPGDVYEGHIINPYNSAIGLTYSGATPYAYHHAGAYEFRNLDKLTDFNTGVLIIHGYDVDGATNDDRTFIRMNANRYSHVKNGVAISTTAYTTSAGLWVGRYSLNETGLMKFRLLEAAYWNRVLTSTELAGLEEYAKKRYFEKTEKRIVVVGDSLSEGYPITLDSTSYPNQLDALYDSTYVVTNASIRAYTISQLESTANAQGLDKHNDWNQRNVFIQQGGTNDMDPTSNNLTAAQAVTAATTSVTNRHKQGWKVLICTVPPRGDLTGGNATTFEARRLEFNTALRNGDTGADGVIDWAADSRLQDPNNATYYYDGDKVHFTAAGNAVLAELAKAAIDQIPVVN